MTNRNYKPSARFAPAPSAIITCSKCGDTRVTENFSRSGSIFLTNVQADGTTSRGKSDWHSETCTGKNPTVLQSPAANASAVISGDTISAPEGHVFELKTNSKEILERGLDALLLESNVVPVVSAEDGLRIMSEIMAGGQTYPVFDTEVAKLQRMFTAPPAVKTVLPSGAIVKPMAVKPQPTQKPASRQAATKLGNFVCIKSNCRISYDGDPGTQLPIGTAHKCRACGSLLKFCGIVS